MWKDNTAPRPSPVPAPEPKAPVRVDPPAKPQYNPQYTPLAAAPAARADPNSPRKESLIAPDLTIEGKIEGSGSVRVAGKFKGDVNVQGDLAIEEGAKLTGSVRADKVTIAGELEGNIEQSSRVDLQQTAVLTGDLKAGSLTVAAGARMRGRAEFGWDDAGAKSGQARPRQRRWQRRELMSSARPASPGATRACPHCRETILESASVCPACRHYLRYEPMAEAPQEPALTPLRIEGSIRHPADGEAWEYTVVVSIRERSRRRNRAQAHRCGCHESQRTVHLHLVCRSRVGQAENIRPRRHAPLSAAEKAAASQAFRKFADDRRRDLVSAVIVRARTPQDGCEPRKTSGSASAARSRSGFSASPATYRPYPASGAKPPAERRRTQLPAP